VQHQILGLIPINQLYQCQHINKHASFSLYHWQFEQVQKAFQGLGNIVEVLKELWGEIEEWSCVCEEA
jgi:hypothetical protein